MAIAYMVVSNMSRGSGKSSVAASAYRSGETLHNEREGNTYSYALKTDRVYSEMLTPDNAPAWAKDRGKLWNSVEEIEKQANARLAREILIALPKELSQQQNIALARAYAQTFTNEGMVADVSIHDKGDGNPHAHIMLTTRPFNEDGTWGAKSRKEYILDDEGQKITLNSGQYKSRKVDLVDWNKTEKVEEWRHRYEDITNAHLGKAGIQERIDARSYERQGKEQTPTVHMGHYAHELEKQGIETRVGNINRQIRFENQEREALKAELHATLSAIESEQTWQEVLRHKTITHEELQKKAAEWERVAREALVAASSPKNQESSGWEELKREAAERTEARRQDIIRKHTISEEELQKKAAEWERVAREAAKHPPSEPSGWEALSHEAAEREEARNRQEQEARDAQARRTFEEREQRKFVKPSPFERPFRLARYKHMRRPDWDTMAEALRAREEGHLDWQKLAERAEARRVDWQKLAEQEAGRLDWKKLAEEANARQVDWQKHAEHAEAGQTDWQKLVEESKKQREQPKSESEEKRPLRDLYKTDVEPYTERQKKRDDEDKRK